MKSFPIKPLVIACAVAITTAGTSVLADDSGKNETSDTWAKASLTTTYTLNRHLNPFDIETEVKGGVATLTGTVESKAESHLAEELALGVDGIREVKNQLNVSPDASRKDNDKAAKSGDRDFMRKVEDANLTTKVKSQLLWNSSTDGLDINVDTRNGIVSLAGNVDSKTEADLAEQIARNTDDVLGVENKLKVSGKEVTAEDKAARESRQAGQEISDSWITTKVKSALMYNRNVDGNDINVETSNGVVNLRGHVNSDFERKQAISITRSVKGVKNVKSELSDS